MENSQEGGRGSDCILYQRMSLNGSVQIRMKYNIFNPFLIMLFSWHLLLTCARDGYWEMDFLLGSVHLFIYSTYSQLQFLPNQIYLFFPRRGMRRKRKEEEAELNDLYLLCIVELSVAILSWVCVLCPASIVGVQFNAVLFCSCWPFKDYFPISF